MNSREAEIKPVALAEVLAIRQEVMYPGQPAAWAKVEGDENALHWGLYAGGRLVSVISLFNSNNYGGSLQFRKFATLVSEQGKGYGTYLLKAVLEYAITQGYKAIWCNARITALDWYGRFEFLQEGVPWNKNGIDYIIIKKSLY
jgi:phosphoribosylformimino-5-aminoimidazole carboxamide ribotide isomerase